MTGAALSGNFDYGSSAFGSDFNFYRGGIGWEQGIKFFKSHNLIYSANATAGHNLLFWNENTAGGNNLRGYLGQQFRGDTQIGAKLEYHFPLFSISSLDFRALGFYDFQAVWFRNPPDGTTTVNDPNGQGYGTAYVQRNTPDARTFPTAAADRVQPGQHPQRRRRRAPVLPSLGRGSPGRGRLRLRDRSEPLAVHHRRRRLVRRPAGPGCWKVVRLICQKLNRSPRR